jgi:hypothetical protein
MRLPNPDRAVVSPEKVRDYLLSPEHQIGRFKAVVFQAVGYERRAWQRLQSDLVTGAHTEGALLKETTPFGQKFELPVVLVGPLGRDLPVLTVWFVRSGEDFPRLVTAFPRGA